MEYSLFDEASRDYDAEVSQHRATLVRVAVQQEVLPFLAIAKSPEEYRHRKALIYDRLQEIASRYEASADEPEDAADRMFTLLHEARQHRPVMSASKKCGGCGHSSTDHAEGLRCPSCGCTDFTAASDEDSDRKEGRRVTADEGDGPFS